MKTQSSNHLLERGGVTAHGTSKKRFKKTGGKKKGGPKKKADHKGRVGRYAKKRLKRGHPLPGKREKPKRIAKNLGGRREMGVSHSRTGPATKWEEQLGKRWRPHTGRGEKTSRGRSLKIQIQVTSGSRQKKTTKKVSKKWGDAKQRKKY